MCFENKNIGPCYYTDFIVLLSLLDLVDVSLLKGRGVYSNLANVEISARFWRDDRVAKGHAWKACKVLKPRGFESRSLRQMRIVLF